MAILKTLPLCLLRFAVLGPGLGLIPSSTRTSYGIRGSRVWPSLFVFLAFSVLAHFLALSTAALILQSCNVRGMSLLHSSVARSIACLISSSSWSASLFSSSAWGPGDARDAGAPPPRLHRSLLESVVAVKLSSLCFFSSASLSSTSFD